MASIAVSVDFALVTRNVKDFEQTDAPLINPWLDPQLAWTSTKHERHGERARSYSLSSTPAPSAAQKADGQMKPPGGRNRLPTTPPTGSTLRAETQPCRRVAAADVAVARAQAAGAAASLQLETTPPGRLRPIGPEPSTPPSPPAAKQVMDFRRLALAVMEQLARPIRRRPPTP
jgi:hypothetical protein